MTTCEGSSLPQPRASRVAAGMPMAVTPTMSAMITGRCSEAGRWDARAHHNRTAASDPQVPGPGRKRPAPKKVAMSVAQRGAGLADTAGSVGLFAMLIGIARLNFLRIVQRGGDHVRTACPLAEINEAAAVAAKRKLGAFGEHDLLAGRTSQTD